MVWLCDQEPVRTFQKGPAPEKAKLRRWWTYLSQLRLSVHHIQGVKNECADYVISRGIWASQKLSGASLLDLSKLHDPRTLGYLLIFGLYSKRIACCWTLLLLGTLQRAEI